MSLRAFVVAGSWRRAALVVLAGTLFGVLGIGTGMASAVDGGPGTYADFSRLTERSAGQFGPQGGPLAQWSWRTDGPGEYSISWKQDEPESRERFVHSGDWLLLDGWSDNGTYYLQRVTSESQGDASCGNMAPVPLDGGRQHYVRWDIPTAGYCLESAGTIVEQSSGKVINFRHRQVWSPPTPCSNSAFQDRICIRQHETWWDDNQHSMSMTLDRDQDLGKGLGMAFRIDQHQPTGWSAELKNAWTY